MTKNRGLFIFICAMGLHYIPLQLNAESTSNVFLNAVSGFQTKLIRKVKNNNPVERHPSTIFTLVKYPTPIGKMSALLSKPKDPNKKYPAIIWITGGFPAGGIGSSAWKEVSPLNDQSAKVYRQSGMIMMYPFAWKCWQSRRTRRFFW